MQALFNLFSSIFARFITCQHTFVKCARTKLSEPKIRFCRLAELSVQYFQLFIVNEQVFLMNKSKRQIQRNIHALSSILSRLLVKLSFIYFGTLKKCIRQQSYKNLFTHETISISFSILVFNIHIKLLLYFCIQYTPIKGVYCICYFNQIVYEWVNKINHP